MTKDEARELAGKVRDGLPWAMRQRLKAIHVFPRLHSGHLTIRVFMVPQAAEEPDPYVFSVDDLQ